MVTRNKKKSKTGTDSESADVTVEQEIKQGEAVEDAKSRSISSKVGEPSAESANVTSYSAEDRRESNSFSSDRKNDL